MRRTGATRAVAAVLLLSASGGWSQVTEEVTERRARELRRVALELHSIDPRSEDVSDLVAVAKALGDARIVVLGEATVGDGRLFLAKSRLTRFLHRERGFDVLVFDSGFYDSWKAWRRIREGGDPEACFRAAVPSWWSDSAQLAPLIEHFAAATTSEHVLELSGIDPELTGTLAARQLVPDLVRLGEHLGLSGDSLSERLATPLKELIGARQRQGAGPDPAELARLRKALDELESRLQLAEGAAVPDRDFWLRLLASTTELARRVWASAPAAGIHDPEGFAVRDRLMGEQLAWLARRRFPDRKIVVWMLGLHAARGLDEVEVPTSKPAHARLFSVLRPAADIAAEALGEELYTIGSLAYRGSYAHLGRASPIELWQPSPGSLEELLHRTGHQQAFVDLRNTPELPRWLRRPTIARPMGYMEMRARWPEVFDGFLFLDRMEPARPREAGTAACLP